MNASPIPETTLSKRDLLFAQFEEVYTKATGEFFAIKCPYCTRMVPEGAGFCCEHFRHDYRAWYLSRKQPSTPPQKAKE